MDSGHFKHLQHMFGIKSSWGPWGLFPPEGLCEWAVYQGWEPTFGLQGSDAWGADRLTAAGSLALDNWGESGRGRI